VFRAVVLTTILAIGCGSPSVPALNPVVGKVFFKGEPATGALVRFHPVGDPAGRIYQGVVESDGGFELTTTTKGDGVPAGTYAVCLTWADTVNVNDAEQKTPDKFGRRYAAPANPYTTFEVKPGRNELPRIDVN
jgi:hypothetical protein